MPHPGWGEEVAAVVVLSAPATEAELIAFCRQRLAEFKRPKQIFIAETIPRTATGKIQRRLVAQAFSPTSAVKFVVVGAGAIGGYVGGRARPRRA